MRRSIILVATILLLTACSPIGGGSADTQIVLTVDGHDVTYDEYRYFYLNTKLDMSGGDPDFWTRDNEMKLNQAVIDVLKKNYAVYKLAEKYNIKVDSVMKKEINEKVKTTIEHYGGEDEYYEVLSAYFMTGNVYRNVLELFALDAKLRGHLMAEYSGDILADDKTVEEDFYKNFAHVVHIMLMHNNGKTFDQNKADAEELRRRAVSGEDFNALIAEYNQDPGYDDRYGYYMTYGEYDQIFEEASFALATGEISGVVRTSQGYHVIKRLALDPAYLDTHYESVRKTYKTRVINERIEETAVGIEVKFSELYDTISVGTME